MSCDIREIQRLETEMLKECKRLCDKHHITYFLSNGTLIGAAREKGFIAWDDDIDIMLPYEELARLIKVFREEGDKRYIITNHSIEKYYPFSWTKIRMHDTTSMPVMYKSLPLNWGICMDLFPLYPVSDNKIIRSLEIFIFKVARKLLIANMTKCEPKTSAVNRVIEFIPLSIRRYLADKGFRVFCLHKKNTEYLYMTSRGGKVIKREDIFGEETYLTFEGESYRVPAQYDKHLTTIYGDYMTPPPKEEQGGHDLRMGEIIWDCEKSYKNYL